jgi:hypothetical protein
MNFGKMITFSISSSIKKKAPNNEESDYSETETRKKENQSLKESLGIVQPLDPMGRNAYSLIQDPVQLTTSNTFASAVNQKAELEKTASVGQ